MQGMRSFGRPVVGQPAPTVHCDIDAMLKMLVPAKMPMNAFVHDFIVFNIPKAAFRARASMWKHIDDSCYSGILYSVAQIVQDPRLGQSYISHGVPNHHYVANSVPKIICMVEDLLSERGDFEGERIWCFSMDETLKFEDGFENLLANTRARDEEKALRKPVPPQQVYEPFFEIRTPVDLYVKLWSRYNETINMNLDSIYDGENGMTDPRSPINPKNVLSFENAKTLGVAGVCEKQRKMESYFDMRNGGERYLFKQFPFEDKTYRFHSMYFTPKQLYNSLLPRELSAKYQVNRLHEDLFRANENISQMQAKKDEIMRQIQDDIDDLNEAMLGMSTDEREKRRAAIQAQRDENDSMQRDLMIQEALAMETKQKIQRLEQHLNSDGMPTVTNDEEHFAQTNELISLRLENIKLLTDILRSCNNRKTDADNSEYTKKIQDFRMEALNKFWTTFRFASSGRLTKGVQKVREYFSTLDLTPEKQFCVLNQMVSDLSIFGNTVVRIMYQLFYIQKIQTNFGLYFLEKAAADSSSYYVKDEIKPNMLISGEGGAGKSYVMDVVEENSVPGTVVSTNHFTTQAWNTEGETMCDRAFFMHELTFNILSGTDQQGKQTSDNPFLKGALSKGFQRTIEFFRKDDGTREAKEVLARNNGVLLINLNGGIKDKNDPAAQRFMMHSMSKKERADLDDEGMLFNLSWASIDKGSLEYRTVVDRERLIHMYCFIWNQAIACMVLPQIDTDLAMMVARDVFSYLKRRGIPKPSKRNITMYITLCRQMTIYHGVCAEFMSELGRKHRRDEYNYPKAFTPLMLMDLMKWGWVTQEIAVFVLTLMEELWIPKLKLRVARACFLGAVEGAKIARRRMLSAQWPTTWTGMDDFNAYPFRVEVVKEGNPQLGIETETRVNTSYIQLTADQMGTIGKRIKECMHMPCSEQDILNTITMGCSEFLEVSVTELVEVADKEDPTKKCFQLKPTNERISIPSFIVDRDPLKKETKRLSFAVDLLGSHYDDILRDAIKSIGHKFQTPRKCITAFPAKEPNNLGRTFVNIMDTIQIEPRDRTIRFENQYSVSEEARVRLFNNTEEEEDAAAENDASNACVGDNAHMRALSARYFYVDRDLEYTHGEAYWLRECVPDPLERMNSITEVGIETIMRIRSENPKRYERINKSIIADYPDELIQDTMEVIMKKEVMKKYYENATMNSTERNSIEFAPYSSLHGLSPVDGSSASLLAKRKRIEKNFGSARALGQSIKDIRAPIKKAREEERQRKIQLDEEEDRRRRAEEVSRIGSTILTDIEYDPMDVANTTSLHSSGSNIFAPLNDSPPHTPSSAPTRTKSKHFGEVFRGLPV